MCKYYPPKKNKCSLKLTDTFVVFNQSIFLAAVDPQICKHDIIFDLFHILSVCVYSAQ